MTVQESATLARIETRLEDLHRELLGDGSPGRVQKLEELTARLSDRVNYAYGGLGVLAFFGTVVQVVIFKLVSFFYHR